MKVRLQAADSRACARYRLEEPARVARAQERIGAVVTNEPFDIYQAPFGHVVCSRQKWKGEDRVVEWQEDVAIFQRPCHPLIVEAIPYLQRRGVAVVVDLDDDLGRLIPQHPSHDYFARTNKNTQRACLLADLVTCTTDALAARYAPHGRYAVLPNCVPHYLTEMDRASNGKTLGWAGFQEMHPCDLEVTYGGVRQALDGTDWAFRNIGPPEGINKALGLDHFEATGVIEMHDYYLCLGTLDVGIVPLAQNQFNAAKSYLKGLEFAARGVPFVASPTPEYQKLSDYGLGVIAKDRGRSWKSALRKWMNDPLERKLYGEEGQVIVQENFTYEKQGWRWVEAWQQAMDNRALDFERAAVLA